MHPGLGREHKRELPCHRRSFRPSCSFLCFDLLLPLGPPVTALAHALDVSFAIVVPARGKKKKKKKTRSHGNGAS